MQAILTLLLLLSLSTAIDLPPQTPIIGIYTQTHENTTSSKSSYIASSYVKFIQMSGAQVVPIFSFSDTSVVLELLGKINGVLFPGGGMQFSMNNQWTKNADAIFNYAKKQNENGNVFPIFATCLGFQLVSYLTAGHDNGIITRVHGDDAIIHPLIMEEQSYLFGSFSKFQTDKIIKGNGLFYFNHNYAVTIDTFNRNPLLKGFWKLTSQAETPQQQRFVASFEAKNYPFYGVQFHPQKNLFEWKVYADRSLEGVQVVQIMSNKFVEMARKNKNKFPSVQDFMKYSIYNYNTTYPTTMSFTQIYIFNETPRMLIQ